LPAFDAKVDLGSLIHVSRNAYSVNSRLIRETVEVRLYVEHLEVWYAQRLVERLPRLRGRNKHRVSYRHIIDWLLRKPSSPQIPSLVEPSSMLTKSSLTCRNAGKMVTILGLLV
jgi:hypothetical protein